MSPELGISLNCPLFVVKELSYNISMNKNRRRTLFSWNDLQVALTFTAFMTVSWVVGYLITTFVLMFQQ